MNVWEEELLMLFQLTQIFDRQTKDTMVWIIGNERNNNVMLGVAHAPSVFS